MENGLVEESINFVREKYHEYLKNGNMEFSEEFFAELKSDIAAFFDTACATDVATLVQKRYDRFRKFGSEV